MQKHGLFKSSFFYIVIFLIIMGAVYIASDGGGNSTSVQKIQSSTFVRNIKSNRVKSFSLQPHNGVYHVTGLYRKPRTVKTPTNSFSTSKSNRVTGFSTNEPENGNMINYINRKATRDNVKENTLPRKSTGLWLNLLIYLLPLLIVFFLFYLLMSHAGAAGGGSRLMRIGKNTVKPVKHVHVKFSDVAGEDAEKQNLEEVVRFLKNPKKYQKYGAKIPHGVLLEGPPGTGKTLLAKAVAGEAGVPFYSVSGSEFVQMFVGVGASRVRNLFKEAKKHAPSIVFIDEIDAIGRKRSGNAPGGGNSEREQTLNQLLVEMDGFTDTQNVIVLAATNRADVLDSALTRPGRFDRKVYVGRPDVRGRYQILKVHSKKKKFSEHVDLKEIARQTPGFVGADLANLLNEAALRAADLSHDGITQKDLSEAQDQVIMGPAKKHAVVNPNEQRVVAAHEAGHTIVGLVLTNARVVHKVTIVPRGRAGGYTIMLPKEDENLLTKKGALQQLAGFLGGRTAEEILYHSKSSGAVADFKSAYQLARSMVTRFGMSDKIGDVQLESAVQSPYAQPHFSEKTAYMVDTEIKHFIDHAHHVAYQVIQTHRKQHHVIAEALLKYETLDAKEIKSLYRTGHMPAHDPKIAD